MTVPDTRVWLLPNGNLATSSSDPLAEFWIHLRDGEGIEAADVLPAGAAPLTALPEPVPVDRDGHGYLVRHREPFAYFPSVLVHKDTSVAEVRKHIDWLAAELSDQIAALELLELEGSTESAVEAARRKVLQDLKPGVYNLFDEMGNGIVVVTPDGRLLVHRQDGDMVDMTDSYRDRWAEDLILLAEGDLSPVVGE